MSVQQKSTTFVVTLQAPAGSDGIRGLRALLKTALRRDRLRAIDVREHAPELEKLAEASRKVRPNATYRKEFARLRQERRT
jgi:hypothetical protein